MDAKDFISNADNISVKDFAASYNEIKNHLWTIQRKAQDISKKYNLDNLSADQIPSLVQDVKELVNMVK